MKTYWILRIYDDDNKVVYKKRIYSSNERIAENEAYNIVNEYYEYDEDWDWTLT